MVNEKTLELDRRDFPIGMFVCQFMSCYEDGTFNQENVPTEYYNDMKPFTSEGAIKIVEKMIETDFPDVSNIEIHFTGYVNVLNEDAEYKERVENCFGLSADKFIAEVKENGKIIRRYFILSCM